MVLDFKMKEKKEKIQKPNEELEELKKQLEDCRKKSDEYLAGWQRSRADFLNYKKEEIERIGDILKYANLNLILKILPILDNFELAEKNLSENLKDDKNVKGLLQIKTQILDFLKNDEIEEIKAVGEKFDPNLHEAIEEVEREGEETGIILEEFQKGYTLHSRVIRPARVKVVK